MLALRTTAGKAIGFGHLRRCLTLAHELRTGGASEVEFWIDGDPVAPSIARADGFGALYVSTSEPDTTIELLADRKADVLIVDSYAVTPEAFERWRPHVRGGLVALDDLADRALDVNIVINGSPHAASLRYRTTADATLLLGPRYALMRPPFRGVAPRTPRSGVARVLITLGGADPSDATGGAVSAIRRALPDAAVDVVVGPLFGAVSKLDTLAANDPALLRVHRGKDDLSSLMLAADLAVSGGGQTLYELAACGLPTIAICLADNQEGNIAALSDHTLRSAGRLTDVAATGFRQVETLAVQLAADPALRGQLSRTGQDLFDGRGATRAAAMILNLATTRGVRP